MCADSKICMNWKGIILHVLKGAKSNLQAREIKSYLVQKWACSPKMLFQCTDNQDRELKPAQSLKCTAAETVNVGVFFFRALRGG